MFHLIPKPTQGPSFRSLLEEYKSQENTIPDRICLIWLGEDVPNTAERPYQDNLIKHKKLNPNAHVELIVSKKLLQKSDRWDALFQKFFFHGIVLRDLDETCGHYLNYDLMTVLMQDPRYYVWVSDLLRLAVIYDQGGYYYDMDIEPTQAIKHKKAKYGFYCYFPQGKPEDSASFCFQAGVKGHFVYLLCSAVLRHLYLALQREMRPSNREPEWLASNFMYVRQRVISSLSGSAFFCLAYKTSLQVNRYSDLAKDLSYPLDSQAKVSYDGSWLDQCQTELSDREFSTAQVQLACFNYFYERALDRLNENYICHKLKDYFPGHELKSLETKGAQGEVKGVDLASQKASLVYATYFKSLQSLAEQQRPRLEIEYAANAAGFWGSETGSADLSQSLQKLEGEPEEPLLIYQVRN